MGCCWRWPCCCRELIYCGGLSTGNTSSAVSQVDAYSAVGDSWKSSQAMGAQRFMGGAAGLVEGAFVFGGQTNAGSLTGLNQKFDQKTWTTKTSMTTPRSFVPSGAVAGLAIAAAGRDSTFDSAAQNEAYDPGADSWASLTPITTAIYYGPGGEAGGKFYVFCGRELLGVTSRRNQEYDPSGNSWALKTQSPTPARIEHTGGGLGGYCYALGGVNPTTLINNVDRYDPSGDSWAARQTVQSASLGASAVANGKLHWMGGRNGATPIANWIAANFAYDPTANTWASKAVVPSPSRIDAIASATLH